jgi:hypothetical protein
MAVARSNEATIRVRVYLLWEQEGKPEGRETEFWVRAEAAVNDSSQPKTPTHAPPGMAGAKAAKVTTGKAGSAPAKIQEGIG